MALGEGAHFHNSEIRSGDLPSNMHGMDDMKMLEKLRFGSQFWTLGLAPSLSDCTKSAFAQQEQPANGRILLEIARKTSHHCGRDRISQTVCFKSSNRKITITRSHSNLIRFSLVWVRI